MADVRKLLAAERALRAPPKKAASKRPHSEIDESSSTKRQKTSATSATAVSSSSNLPTDFFDANDAEDNRTSSTTNEAPRPITTLRSPSDAPMANATPSLPAGFFNKSGVEPEGVDEDEWAAFQADVADPEPASVISAAAIITAAPTTTVSGGPVEEEQNAADEEGRGEEEDAKNKLMDEFEEMESLEQRVLRLKERREALKTKAADGGMRMEIVELQVQDDGLDSEDEDEDDEDFFRAGRF